MATETWTTVAIPILTEILDGECGDPQLTTSAIIQRTNEDKTVCRTLAALIEDGYIDGATPHWPSGQGHPNIVADILRLTPKGRRAVPQWPSGEAGDVLINTIERMIRELPEGEKKRRLAGFLHAAREVGVEVLTGVVSNVIKATLGLP